MICSACRGSLIKGQAELEGFGSISSPLLRTSIAICVRRVEWKIIAFIVQVQCTDICSWIKHFYSQPGPCRLFSIKYEEQCFLQVSVKYLKQAHADLSCKAHTHTFLSSHACRFMAFYRRCTCGNRSCGGCLNMHWDFGIAKAVRNWRHGFYRRHSTL